MTIVIDCARMFLRRLGSPGPLCAGGCSCPEILEMESGDFAVIGTDITHEASGCLLPGTGCGVGERIVRIPRTLLIAARPQIPVQ